MFEMNTAPYQKLLNVRDDTLFIKIDHDEGMVATVYKVLESYCDSACILKICESPFDYANKGCFLGRFQFLK